MTAIGHGNVFRSQALAALMIVLSPAWAARGEAPAPAGPLVKPTPEQVAWQDLELGMFIH